MKVVYTHWKPEQGLEELQAKIYTTISGLPATADQIRERNMSRSPEMTRYALTEDGKPLAYTTARDSTSRPGVTYIGYPWAMKGCPANVQEKIFTELFDYLVRRKETTVISTTLVFGSKIFEEQLRFFKEKGFVESEGLYRYNLDYDVKEASKMKITGELAGFDNRLATPQDVEVLVELCQSDPYIKRAFPSEEAMRSYFKDRVLKVGHTVLITKGDTVVAASAPLRFKPEGILLTGQDQKTIMRFTAIRPGYNQAWKRLLIEVAKECIAAGWTDIPLRATFSFTSSANTAAGLAAIRPELEAFEIILTHQK
ncbi:MAG: hypothetical protein ACFFCO_05835 [Promethearchaeota archaeon]